MGTDKGLSSIRGWRVKAIIEWFSFSTAYLAVFPGLIGAMSRYEASVATKLLLPNGTAKVGTRIVIISIVSMPVFNTCSHMT